MDALSDVLSLLKLKSYVSGGFVLDPKVGFDFHSYRGMKCYAVGSGSCWLSIESAPAAVRISEGDCVLLPRGLPFCLGIDLALPRIEFPSQTAVHKLGEETLHEGDGGCAILGGHFFLAGGHSDVLLSSLPPIVHIRKEADREAMRWALDRMRKELAEPQPGGYLMGQQLAHMILLQALRLHLQENAVKGVGWLFALADPQLRAAIQCMHDRPGHPWTLEDLASRACMSRTVFAQKFRQKVGMTPMEYLTRWRMLLAGDRLKSSEDSVQAICSSLGYGTESAFGRAFRRVWDCSPREYRRSSGINQPASP